MQGADLFAVDFESYELQRDCRGVFPVLLTVRRYSYWANKRLTAILT
jgi:hypothetical protein